MDGADVNLHDSKIDLSVPDEHKPVDGPPYAGGHLGLAAVPAIPPTPPRRGSGDSKSDKHASPGREQPQYSAQEAADALDQAEQGIDAESAGSLADDDPGYETDGADSDTMSLLSSARNFMFENGRRYHGYKEGAYLFPNDDREQDREDLKHAMYLLLFNKTLNFAPLEDGNMNVIDLGTGTGIWAMDFADKYVFADVLGVDLSPIQSEWVPPNLKFMVDDVEADWLYPRSHFDYIHTWHTIQAFRNWPLLYKRALRHLKPGAWMECQELNHIPECTDNTMAPNNAMAQYWAHVSDGLSNLGINFRLAPQLASLMRDAGFVNVTERIFYTPIGPWPKNRALREVGLYWRAVLMEGLEAIALGPMTRGLGWRKEEVEVFLVEVRKAYLERATHAWMPFYIVYGQKPYGPEKAYAF